MFEFCFEVSIQTFTKIAGVFEIVAIGRCDDCDVVIHGSVTSNEIWFVDPVVFDDPPKLESSNFDDLWIVLNPVTSRGGALPRLVTEPNDSGRVSTRNRPFWNVLG